MRNKLLILFLISIFAGCSNTETIIRDKKIELTVRGIKDTVEGIFKEFPKAELENIIKLFSQLPDSAIIEAEISMPNSPIKGKLKYKPRTNEFIADLPPQKVDTSFTDTTTVTEKKQITTPEKFGYGIIGVIIFIVIAGCGAIVLKLKKII